MFMFTAPQNNQYGPDEYGSGTPDFCLVFVVAATPILMLFFVSPSPHPF
jgi:hypothetical protein